MDFSHLNAAGQHVYGNFARISIFKLLRKAKHLLEYTRLCWKYYINMDSNETNSDRQLQQRADITAFESVFVQRIKLPKPNGYSVGTWNMGQCEPLMTEQKIGRRLSYGNNVYSCWTKKKTHTGTPWGFLINIHLYNQ